MGEIFNGIKAALKRKQRGNVTISHKAELELWEGIRIKYARVMEGALIAEDAFNMYCACCSAKGEGLFISCDQCPWSVHTGGHCSESWSVYHIISRAADDFYRASEKIIKAIDDRMEDLQYVIDEETSNQALKRESSTATEGVAEPKEGLEPEAGGQVTIQPVKDSGAGGKQDIKPKEVILPYDRSNNKTPQLVPVSPKKRGVGWSWCRKVRRVVHKGVAPNYDYIMYQNYKLFWSEVQQAFMPRG